MTCGVSLKLLQQAVTACVLKKGYYAAETWWPGRFRQSSAGCISNRIEAHTQLLEKVAYNRARAILPAYRTTPTSALLKESQILPPEIQLNLASQTFAACTAHLDPYHPLRKRADKIMKAGKPTSRFAHWILALPRSEIVNPIARPLWKAREHRNSIMQRISGPQGRSKDQAANDFIEFLLTIPGSDSQVYSDASKSAPTDGTPG